MATSDRLSELLHQYFEIGVAEGREGRTHDTEAGDAQRVLSEIEYEIAVHRLAKATPTDIKVIASQVAYVSLSSINAHSSRAVEIATAHVERALVASAISVADPIQPTTDGHKQLQAVDKIKPVAWVYAADLEKGDGCFGNAKGEVCMSRDGEWINVDTPLYAAPPTPSVAVKALEALLSAVKSSVHEKDEPHRVILKDGTAVTGEIADRWLNFMRLIREVCEQALSAQVQDAAVRKLEIAENAMRSTIMSGSIWKLEEALEEMEIIDLSDAAPDVKQEE